MIVVPEVVSNSLIISATPRYFKEIMKIIEDLDRRPPMVMIQVLIAEVLLNNVDEFGIEVGIQDSVLFDRSGTAAAAGTTASQLVPGFNFNNSAASETRSPGESRSNRIARLDQLLGWSHEQRSRFRGLVLSASSWKVSASCSVL